jgi:hypothetical protein
LVVLDDEKAWAGLFGRCGVSHEDAEAIEELKIETRAQLNKLHKTKLVLICGLMYGMKLMQLGT